MGNGKGFGKYGKGGGKGGKGGGKGGKGGGGGPTKTDWKGYNPDPSVIRNPQWMHWYPGGQPAQSQAAWFQGPAQHLYAAGEATSWLEAPGAMLAGSFRMLNPKQSKCAPELKNAFSVLTRDDDEDDETDKAEMPAKIFAPEYTLVEAYGGRCRRRQSEDEKGNSAKCCLEATCKSRLSLGRSPRGAARSQCRHVNTRKDLATSARLSLESASLRGLIQEAPALDLPELSLALDFPEPCRTKKTKGRRRFEKMPPSKATSKEARKVPPGKPQAPDPQGVVGIMDYPPEEAAMPKRQCRWMEDKEEDDAAFTARCDEDDAVFTARCNKEQQDRLKSRQHMLKVFSEKRLTGALMPLCSSTEWEYVEAVLDSGATVTVIPAHVGQGYEIVPSAASKAGVMYEIANGEEIPNLGEKLMAIVTDDGAWKGLVAQVADVSKMLQSVRSLVKAGHTVVFGDGEDGGSHYIYQKVTGECIGVRDDGVNYLMGMHIVPRAEAGFARPEQ